ncbi:MAG: siderophore-interacting protein, partial [Thermomicrobiales bacterium]
MTATAIPTKRPRRLERPLKTYFTQVVRTVTLTPHLRRITFGGGDLDRFLSAGPDQFITVLLPHPHQERPLIHPDFTWEDYRDMPEETRPISRNYTVRRHRPEIGELDVDFVLHGDLGPATRWAARAKPGDHLGIWGPRMAYDPPPGVDWQLLAGDETAVPAIGAILESLPPGARARVVIEVAGPADELPFPTAAAVEVTWLHRGDFPPGESDQLLAAIRQETFPDGILYAWA